MISFLTTGTILGLSAGLAPGPLLALVISETIQHDVKAGIRVALAPILTDLPIVVITLFILAKISNFHAILGIISIVGACFILFLGIKNFTVKEVHIDIKTDEPRSLQKGVLVNFLSPHPYLFWFSVGGPLVMKANILGLHAALSFIVSFYVLLVGSKVFLAILTGKSRSIISGGKYILTMKLLGFILVLLAVFLFKDGLQLLGLI